MDLHTEILLFQDVESLTQDFSALDVRPNDPRMSAENPSQKLDVWAVFWFLK